MLSSAGPVRWLAVPITAQPRLQLANGYGFELDFMAASVTGDR